MNRYTDAELTANYEKFIASIEKVFTGDRLEALLCMYSEEELGLELAMAPASGKLHFHSAYAGGYIDHVMNVVKLSYKMKKLFVETGGFIDFEDEELLFAAFHHDLGKLGNGKHPYYVPQDSEWHRNKQNEYFTHNPDLPFFDVTDRSLYLLQRYGITYTEKEMLGIMLADGLYNESRKKYWISYNEQSQLKTVLPHLIHWADNMSCQVEHSEWRNIANP